LTDKDEAEQSASPQADVIRRIDAVVDDLQKGKVKPPEIDKLRRGIADAGVGRAIR